MPTTAANVFLIIAGACAIVLTLALIAVAYFCVVAALEVRRVARAARAELEAFGGARRMIARQLRFAGKWARIFPRRTAQKWRTDA